MIVAGAQPRITILRALSQDPEAFISGESLAEKLGVSRVTVWKYFEQLREEGFEFEAARNRGYRLAKSPVAAHQDWICALLKESTGRDVSLEVFSEIDSTNSEAERWLSNGGDTPHFVIAKRQTHGRGRQGNVWESQDDGNLYLSAAFRPELLPSQMQLFTLWAGLHVAQALRSFEPRLQVKWPNDLWIQGKKCAGMLTEARIDSDRIRDLIFGLGLNINEAPKNFEEEKACLFESGSETPVSIVAATVIAAILRAFESVSYEGTARKLVELWPSYDALADAEVVMQAGSTEIRGIAKGVREDGALQIDLPEGRIHSVHSGEVNKVRPKERRGG